jgi:hypothetical protein
VAAAAAAAARSFPALKPRPFQRGQHLLLNNLTDFILQVLFLLGGRLLSSLTLLMFTTTAQHSVEHHDITAEHTKAQQHDVSYYFRCYY